MPRRHHSAHEFRTRVIFTGLILGGHVTLLVLFSEPGNREAAVVSDERMTSVLIDLPEEPPPELTTGRTARRSAVVRLRDRPAMAAVNAPATGAPITAPQAIDWHDAARRAAAREAASPEVHDFGFPKREPKPREKKEFGWDKVHTERVRALEGGGIGIRLSDNCEIALLPLPIGGCSFGKRKARGDLFDEMKAPAEPGDWK